MRHSWLRDFARRVFGTPRRRKGTITRRKADRQPAVETLEIRLVPSTLTVTSNADTNTAGTLRFEINQSNTDGGGDTIVFSNALAGQTIILSGSELPQITANVTITGLGSSQLTIDGNHNSRVFDIAGSVTASLSELTITGGQVTGGGSQGGGVSNSGTLTMTDCTVSGNTASFQGGGIQNSGSLTLSGCTVSGNSTSGSSGGINTQGSATLVAVNTTISGNTASFAGGGMSANGTALLTNCTISGNTSNGSAGGINEYVSTMTLTDCTVSGNHATTDGGGVYMRFGSLHLIDTTISANTATSGGGISNTTGTGHLTIVNTIVSANTATTGPDIHGSLNTDNGYNLLGAALSGTTFGTGDVFSDTPLLTPLGYYGGPTQTIALEAGSPALGAGNPAAAGLPATDQRGFARVVSSTVDIGAFQSQTAPLAVNTADDTATGAEPSGELSLRNAIALADALAPAGGAGISFNIPTSDAGYNNGTGIYTIAPVTALPAITARTTIDGTTQPGFTSTPVIQLDGAGAGAAVTGLTVTASNSTIRGLVINSFGGGGIELTGAGAHNDTIDGNYIGTDPTGTAALGNTVGLQIDTGARANTVGGTTAGARNLISGNTGNGISLGYAPDTTIEGNYIGVDALGTAALANTDEGVNAFTAAFPFNFGLAIDDNVISGNGGRGIYLQGAFSSTIRGNLVGTDPTGSVGLGNQLAGVLLTSSGNNTIGGSAPGQGNVISANGADGLDLFNFSNNNKVEGNFIGTTAGGGGALGNAVIGVRIFNASQGNQIGTAGTDGAATDALEGNVISANQGAANVVIDGDNNAFVTTTTANLIAGNVIGPAKGGGAFAYLNPTDGVFLKSAAAGNTIGFDGAADAAGMRNLISDNAGYGVVIRDAGTANNVVAGNEISSNAKDGVFVNSASNTIGGTAAGQPNDILFNLGNGILLTGGGATYNLIQGNGLGGESYTGGGGSSAGVNGLEIANGANNNTVNGGNVLSANGNDGLLITDSGTTGNVVQGNFLGTEPTGTSGIFNIGNGLEIANGASGNTIGGASPAVANVLSGNTGDGVYIHDSGTSANVVQNNFIGTDIHGTSSSGLENAAGVEIALGASANVIGAGNLISGNTSHNVSIHDVGTTGNVVSGNKIGTEVSGTAPIHTGFFFTEDGVDVANGASQNTVGGTTAAARNLISGNPAEGVNISGPGTNGNVVEGNYIGTDGSGTARLGNTAAGVLIAGGAAGNTVGGTAAGAGNVVSANGNAANVIGGVYLIGSGTSGNVVAGNLIGTDKSGTLALGNNWDAVGIEGGASGNTIGGTAPGARNVLSASAAVGAEIDGAGSSANLIAGNFIGTDVSGTTPLGNAIDGVLFRVGAAGNTVGGTTAAARNVISGNTGDGVDIHDAGTSGNLVEGDYIGTNAAGTAALGNGAVGVSVTNAATGNVIGGSAVGAGNVISGNNSGIDFVSGGNTLAGNLIGTDKTGAVALGNNNGAPTSGLGHYNVYTSGANNVIGGTATGAGNVIAGSNVGVWVQNNTSTGTVLQGNEIGTNLAGTAALANVIGVILTDGVTHVTIGGTTATARNVISGNTGAGVDVNGTGTGASGNLIEGNFIGTNAGGNPLGNGGAGVSVIGGAANNVIGGTAPGMANTIAFNVDGVAIDGAASTGNIVRGNSIHDNAFLGIHLTNNGDHSQAFPVLTAGSLVVGLPTSVSGFLTGAATTVYTLDFYANNAAGSGGFGQGQFFLGSFATITDATGHANFTASMLGSTLPSQVVSATATDPAGNTSQFDADVGVAGYNNTNPGVTINGPANAVAGAPVSLTSTLSDTTKNKTYTFAWTVTQPANAAFTLPAGTIADEPTLVFIPPTPGTYVASLTVKDNLGGLSTATLTLLARVPGPGVVIKGINGAQPPVTDTAGTAVSLTSVVAEPTGATTTAYAWSVALNGQPYSLPSGTVTNTKDFSFTPAANGLYEVSLSVNDSAGGTGSTSVFVVVAGAGQSATIYNVPRIGHEGTQITVNGVGNSSLIGSLTYNWAVYKNGATAPFAVMPSDTTGSFAFTPDQPASYQLTLVISDTHGHLGIAVPVTITVLATPPTATISQSPTSATAGQAVTLQGSATSAGAADPVTSLTWRVSSGGTTIATGAGATFTFTPNAAGTDVVTLTATDAAGSQGSTFVSFPVTQVVRTLTLSGTPQEGVLAPVTASVNNAPAGVSFTFAWSVQGQAFPFVAGGPGTTTAATSNFSFAPPAGGKYLVGVTATGSDGSTAATSHVFTVAPVPPTVSINGLPSGSILEGTPVALAARASDAGGSAEVLRYQWTVTGPAGFLLTGTAATLGFTPVESGSYAVNLAVVDASGASGTATPAGLTVLHVVPVPVIQSAGGTTLSGDGLTFSANLGATVPDPGSDDVFTYAWSVSGGQVLSQSSATASTFSFSGSTGSAYTVTLTVTDDDDPAGVSASSSIVTAGAGQVLTLAANALGGGPVLVFAGAGSTVDASALSGSVVATAVGVGATLMGGAGPSVLQGDSSFNSLIAGSGPTTLIASLGDTLVGGSGSNLFALNAARGEVVQAGSSSPSNTLSFAPSAVGVMVNLGAGVAQFVAGTGAMPVSLSGTFQSLVGGSGNDTLVAGAAPIFIQAGSGNALLSTGGGTGVTLFGGSGNDTLMSSGGSSVTMQGGSGNDTLMSSGGSSITMFGGSGNDTLMSSGGTSISMVAGGGNDTLTSSGGTSVTMFGGSGNDSLMSSGGTSVTMQGGSGNSTLSSSGGSSITMFGGTGNDTLMSSGGTSVSMVGGSGNDTLTSSGGSSITMFGGSGNDSLMSSGGTSVTMVSGGGNDTLSSSGGSSITMFGGGGNDSLQSSGGTSVSMVGGSGNETISSSGGSSITMFGGSGNDSLQSSGGTSVTMVSGGGNDTITSSGGSSVTMFGGGGNDSLQSSGGTSVSMVGGSGNETISSSGGSSITMFGGTGNDTLTSSGGTSISMVAGSGNDTITSSGGSSVTMFGGSGNDSLSSSGGTSVTMVGGSGNATLSSSGDSNILMQPGVGVVTVPTSGGSSITMFGGTGNDTMIASGGTSITMVGGSGNDSLSASGNTTLVMAGGSGNETLSSSGGTSVTMFGGTGNDSLSSSGGSSVTMQGGSGNDTMSSSGGSSISMVGGSGNDTIISSGGSSITMFGGTGNDTLMSSGGTSVTIVGGTGNDTVTATNDSNVLIQSSVVIVTATGGTSVTMFGGTGNDSLSSSGGTSVTIIGGSGNDTLTSSGGTSVTMFGGTGNDSLMSSGGTSVSMVGGSGNSTVSSSGGSSITLFGGTGNDSLQSSGGSGVTMVGGSGNDTLTSGTDANGSGGSSITMFGGTGNDSLSSSGGTSVSMIGGSGNDTLSSSGGSSITMFGGTGNDSLMSSGGSSVSMVGGTGNDTLSSSGGSSITMFGGTGNDSLSSSGGSTITMIGGTGNDTMTSSGGSSVTMFGGTGNDSLSSSGGTSVSIIGGSGNDTLSSSGDNNATLQGGGSGSDSLMSSGGSSVTMFGGAGNDTLLASGGTAIGLYGLQGNNVYAITGPITVALNDLATFGQQQAQTDSQTPGINTITFPGLSNLHAGQAGIHLDLSNTSPGPIPVLSTDPGQPQTVAPGITLSLTGQFQNVVGTPGDDSIKGDASGDLLDGGGGNDTLIGGSGPATLVAGSGNDSLAAGTGGTTFRFAGAPNSFGSDAIDPPAGAVVNLLDFSQFGGPVALNLSSSGAQRVSGSTGLTLTLQNPAAINAVVDSATFNDSIIGNASGDTFFVGGTGNDTFTGGGGADSFIFSGNQLGTDTINETSTSNALNFRGFGGPINLDLTKPAGLQTLSQSAASNLKLTLSNPSAFDVVVSSPYGGSLQGNNDPNETIIGGGGLDTLAAGSGNDYVQNYVTQVVYLDFSNAPPGDHVYTPAEQTAILQGLQRVYAGLNYFFTLSQADAAQQAQLTGGAYATLKFNAGNAGGASNQLDPSNLSLGGTTLINVNPFLGDAANGLVPPTSANIVGLTTTIAAHELGHLSGLQHQDAFGPIGTGIYAAVNPNEYYPTFPGPATALETPSDVMASPASVGSTLLQAAQGTYVGERDAIKLAFNKYGTTLQQANLPSAAVSVSGVLPASAVLPAGTTNRQFTITRAYTLGLPPALAVPNMLGQGARDYGKTFNVSAVAVNGAITTAVPADFYAFTGQAGQVMTFQVVSNNNTLNPHPILPELLVVGPDGTVLGYNVHEFESPDSTLMDITLPTNGTYYVGVDSLLGLTTGNYQLFMYSFATSTGASSATGDKLVSGAGHDTLVGTAGVDQFVNPGNGVQNTNASPTTTTLTGPAVNPSAYGQSVAFTATVVAASGAAPTGSVQFLDTTTGQVLGTAQLQAVGGAGVAQLASAALGVGTNVIQGIYTSNNGSAFAGSNSQDTNTGVTQVVYLTLTSTPSVYVLSPNAAGALTLSGNAQLKVIGPVDVDSSSSSAISVSGNAQVSGSNIVVVGRVQSSGNAHLSPSPVTGAGAFTDPLANLPVPSAGTYGLTSQGSVSVSGNSALTIKPGIYSQISVSGNGKLTMNPGIYVIAGGGFTVTGNASVTVGTGSNTYTGTGVMIYNAGSNYLGSGNSFGGVNLSGNGNVSLTPPSTGTYAGILIFQSHDNTSAVALSGNGIAMPGGAIYAPAAALTMSGNGQFKGSLVVGTLTVSGNAIAQLSTSSDGTAVYAPAQVRTAYGINNLSLDGTGQTIAIVDAYDNPDVYQAVDAFDAQFGPASSASTLSQLYGPAASFLTVLNQQGETTSLPATDPVGPGSDNWEVETALDAEWTHAVAPGARIVLVEADSQSLADLMAAVKTAAGLPGVSVVTMSWGFAEGQDVLAQDEATYDPYFTTPDGHTGVTFVASTGDYGASVLEYPAFSPNVVAVGGTSLTLNADNSYKSETGWGSYSSALGTFLGSGGGLSQYESEPAYQQGVQSTGSRTTPDVSLLSDPATGAWVADPYNLSGDNPWEVVGGTSLSAPAWAGLLAVADQGRVAAGEATLGSAGPAEAQAALYGLSRADYHDVTSGGNGYSAGAGYDLVTGLGSPVADLLIADLVAYSGGPASSTPVAPIAASGLVPSGDGGSGGGTVSAALRVFAAQALAGRVAAPGAGGVSDSALLNSEALPARVTRPTTALAAADGTGAGQDTAAGAGSRVAAPAGPSLNLGGADLAGAANGTAPAGRRGNEPGSGANGAPAWSPVLLDVSSAIGLAPGGVTGALRPEMPADGGGDVLVGGAGDDLLVGGEGRDLLVGGYAARRSATVIDGLDTPAADGWTADAADSRFIDDYFIQNGGDTGEGGGGVP